MGERVDFSTRMVITGDPNLELDEAGVSISIGMSPTYPEQADKLLVGVAQDMLCGIRKYMLRDMFPDWNQVQNILLWVPNWDGHKTLNPILDDGMMVDNGEILYGIVDKKAASATQAPLQVFTGMQRVINYGLCHNGFSIGIGDTFSGPKVVSFITEKIAEKEHRVQEIIDDAYRNRLKSGRYAQEHLKEDDNVKQMVSAGSTDSYSNVSQMSTYVRRQSVEGKRTPFGFCYQTLTHFTKDDFSLEARGVHICAV
ncbi:RNA polymerase II largest subunit [Pisolithus tinctorius]|nr:RNA polymerase II largest subunit [Pisolithus tinctorius]